MSMFRVGQRVICVDDTPTPGFRWMDGDKPIVGQVYTVVGFEIASGVPCIFTAERPSWSFRARRFRPIVERPTNIDIFTAMLNPAREASHV